MSSGNFLFPTLAFLKLRKLRGQVLTLDKSKDSGLRHQDSGNRNQDSGDRDRNQESEIRRQE